MSYHLINLLQKLGRPRVLVLGDLILDRYTWGDAERVSQEAPVILLREERREARLGGAANVANMLRGLEADVTLAGVIGKDIDGVELRAELERAGVDCGCLLVDPERPTTVKERFIGRAQQRHPHQILRVDREVRMPLAAAQARALTEGILETLGDYQAVLISEYGKGVCTPEICRKLIEAARPAGIPVIVDPSSSGDCRNFIGATAVTPNRLETKRATGRAITTIDDAMAAGKRLCVGAVARPCLHHARQRRDRRRPSGRLGRASPHPQARGVRHHRRGGHGAGDDRPGRRRRNPAFRPGPPGERGRRTWKSNRSASFPSRGSKSWPICFTASDRRATNSARSTFWNGTWPPAAGWASGSSSRTAASTCCTSVTSPICSRPPGKGTASSWRSTATPACGSSARRPIGPSSASSERAAMLAALGSGRLRHDLRRGDAARRSRAVEARPVGERGHVCHARNRRSRAGRSLTADR